MPQAARTVAPAAESRLERALSPFTDVRAGEGTTALLMLLNVFLLLVCYSVIKTVREPLILLGGGAEVRSYAAAGQALLLMGFVPLYGWIASRVDRVKLLVSVTAFFVACIELFAAAVAARAPLVGVAFFVWVGIFNISLIAQFWSFANDLYGKEAGDRLFPVIVIGMTAGAPLGSKIAAALFRAGAPPQAILQVSAALLAASAALYLWIDAREERRRRTAAAPLAAGGGFRLVAGSRYLTLVAGLVVLLNVVNTTGEYLVARLLSAHAAQLAAADPAFDRQAFIGAFSGDYQFWVNVAAFLLQAFIASRLVKHAGLAGALLVLPAIALAGYAIVGAGAGFAVVRWIKTAENATDYSIMNTARQLLWLDTSREEKYKAKQAIDTFFVRVGDVLSAAVVFAGTGIFHLTVEQFAFGNMLLTLAWLGVAAMILRPRGRVRAPARHGIAAAAAGLVLLAAASPASAQETRAARMAAERAEKAARLHPWEPDPLERKLELADRLLFVKGPVFPFVGGIVEGGGLAAGPGYRTRYGDTGRFEAHAALSVRNVKAAGATLGLPLLAGGRAQVDLQTRWLDAPGLPFFGIGADSPRRDRAQLRYREFEAGASARVQAAAFVAVGGSIGQLRADAGRPSGEMPAGAALRPTYLRSSVFAEFDSRRSRGYPRSGGFYRLEWSDYRDTGAGHGSFRRIDGEVQRFVPILREHWVIALRALASTTQSAPGGSVPYFMMPALGGSHALRGYPAWRFRDRHRLLFSAEYRWTAGPLVDMAAFIEAGKVAGRRADLSLHGLETTHGIGFSIHTPNVTMARIELARSREGTTVRLSFSPSY
ncbi:MAG: hypothetical protein IT176_00590 [Acidobacteria bacterium]|nr:hypothetical protein [Acidobacteriota bacterium]